MKNISKTYNALTSYEKAALWESIINAAGVMKRGAGSQDASSVVVAFRAIKRSVEGLGLGEGNES